MLYQYLIFKTIVQNSSDLNSQYFRVLIEPVPISKLVHNTMFIYN
jgi:hypothetical protein